MWRFLYTDPLHGNFVGRVSRVRVWLREMLDGRAFYENDIGMTELALYSQSSSNCAIRHRERARPQVFFSRVHLKHRVPIRTLNSAVHLIHAGINVAPYAGKSALPIKNESNSNTDDDELSGWVTGRVRIRIKQQMRDSDFEPFSVSHFEVGKVYEVGSQVATLLIVSGYAEPEMRVQERAADHSSSKKKP